MFTYEYRDEDSVCTTLYDVKFTEDIGVFKTGEKVASVVIEPWDTFPNGLYLMSGIDRNGITIKEQKVKLTAVEAVVNKTSKK